MSEYKYICSEIRTTLTCFMHQMKKISNKKLILSLIKDDLINSKLNIGLSNLGLQPDLYLLGISDTVFLLLGIKSNRKGEELFEHYLDLRQKVEEIDLIKSDGSLEKLALDIYTDLVRKR